MKMAKHGNDYSCHKPFLKNGSLLRCPSRKPCHAKMPTEDWYLEKHTPYHGLTFRVKERLVQLQSAFQRIEVVDTFAYGKMLLLDGCVMLTERDEFIYHEMIVHPVLMLHPNPQRVLVIGGGDGGSVREVLRYPSVERVDLVEIDEAVVVVCKAHFSSLSAQLSNPKVRVYCCDGFDYLDAHAATYDAIVVDSIDPVGEAAKLFTAPFYQKVHRALKQGGLAVFQTESPAIDPEIQTRSIQSLSAKFKHAALHLASIPTYPGGLWSFCIASDCFDPRKQSPQKSPAFLADLRHYTLALHRAAFVLPASIQRTIITTRSAS